MVVDFTWSSVAQSIGVSRYTCLHWSSLLSITIISRMKWQATLPMHMQSNFVISNLDNSNFRLYRDHTLVPAASHCNRREMHRIYRTRVYRILDYIEYAAPPHTRPRHRLYRNQHIRLSAATGHESVGWWNATPHTAIPISRHRPPLWRALMHCNEVNVFRLCIFPLSKPDECKWRSHYSHCDCQQPTSRVTDGNSRDCH